MNRITTVRDTRCTLPQAVATLLPLLLREEIERGGVLPEEITLRAGRYAGVTVGGVSRLCETLVRDREMEEILQQMCRHSLYAYADSICQGFLSLPGGVRVGICGRASVENGRIDAVREVSSLCIRIPHSITVDIGRTKEMLANGKSVLAYAPPGVGKTTFLRSVAMVMAQSIRVAIVDSREELAPTLTDPRLFLDVLTHYPRATGFEIALRGLNPQLLLCDEIGDGEEAHAILRAARCGVSVMATAHGDTLSGLLVRPALRLLHRQGVFDAYLGLRRNGRGGFHMTWTAREEMREGSG